MGSNRARYGLLTSKLAVLFITVNIDADLITE